MIETSRITKQMIVIVTTVTASVILAYAFMPALNNLIATPAYASHRHNFSFGHTTIRSVINENAGGATNCKNGNNGLVNSGQFSSSVSLQQNCATHTGTFVSTDIRP
jgi:hypothetical protein